MTDWVAKGNGHAVEAEGWWDAHQYLTDLIGEAYDQWRNPDLYLGVGQEHTLATLDAEFERICTVLDELPEGEPATVAFGGWSFTLEEVVPSIES